MTAMEVAQAPLESGDHLSQAEFHRRYCDHPELKRAELVQGVVYVSSPVSANHGEPHAAVMGWLYAFKSLTPGLRLADNATVFMGDDSEVQPDACLFREAPAGRVRVIRGEKGTSYLQGTPDLIVEVAASSASYDLHSKKRLYEREGVPEYVVWQVYEQRIDWFVLREGRYVSVSPDENGVIASETFPGLRLAVAKMLAGDDAGVIAAVLTSDAGGGRGL